ncbi:MAG: hypothetical protein PSX71_01740 [bacterium]|nr:hypothetical protein [bacterium]
MNMRVSHLLGLLSKPKAKQPAVAPAVPKVKTAKAPAPRQMADAREAPGAIDEVSNSKAALEERDRCAAIVRYGQKTGRFHQAVSLAFKTTMPTEKCIDLLKSLQAVETAFKLQHSPGYGRANKLE